MQQLIPMKVYYDDRWKESENLSIHEGPSWRHKMRLLRKLLMKYSPPVSNPRILDVACGTATFLKSLQGYNELFGIDHSQVALDIAKENLPKCNFFKIDIENERIYDTYFNVIICTNALEEMRDDYQALKNMHAMLTSSGLLFIIVPHSMKYWTKKDIYGNNKRRYEIEELIQKCSQIGLIKKEIFTWGYPLYSLYYPLMIKVNQENATKKLKLTTYIAKKLLYLVFFIDDLFSSCRRGRVLVGVFSKE